MKDQISAPVRERKRDKRHASRPRGERSRTKALVLYGKARLLHGRSRGASQFLICEDAIAMHTGWDGMGYINTLYKADKCVPQSNSSCGGRCTNHHIFLFYIQTPLDSWEQLTFVQGSMELVQAASAG